MAEIKTVADLNKPENLDRFQLFTDCINVREIFDYIGTEENPNDYGSIFVEYLDGDIGEVYACHSNIPYLSYSVTRIQ